MSIDGCSSSKDGSHCRCYYDHDKPCCWCNLQQERSRCDETHTPAYSSSELRRMAQNVLSATYGHAYWYVKTACKIQFEGDPEGLEEFARKMAKKYAELAKTAFEEEYGEDQS